MLCGRPIKTYRVSMTSIVNMMTYRAQRESKTDDQMCEMLRRYLKDLVVKVESGEVISLAVVEVGPTELFSLYTINTSVLDDMTLAGLFQTAAMTIQQNFMDGE